MIVAPPVRRWLLGGALVLACAVPLVAHAMRERREQRATLDRFAALEAELAPLARHAQPGRRVIINGSPIFFRTSVAQGSLGAALEGVHQECQSGDRTTMLGRAGLPTGRDDQKAAGTSELRLTRFDHQATEGGAAMLCVFHETGGAPPPSGASPPVRYTLAKQADERTVSLITIATESSVPIETLFPAEGDVPGGDFDGVPRPNGSRRVFAASIEGESYGVRIYETRGALEDAVAAYDREMIAQGWSVSHSVASAMPDARVYLRGPVEMVASFQTADGVTSVTLAPLRAPEPPSSEQRTAL